MFGLSITLNVAPRFGSKRQHALPHGCGFRAPLNSKRNDVYCLRAGKRPALLCLLSHFGGVAGNQARTMSAVRRAACVKSSTELVIEMHWGSS